MKYCRNCRCENKDTASFCRACGVKFVQNQEYKPVDSQVSNVNVLNNNYSQPAKKSSKASIAVIAILCTLIVVCIGALIAILCLPSDEQYNSVTPEAKQVEKELDEPVEEEPAEEKPVVKKTTYKLIKTNGTWEQAYTNAKNYGGELACINSQDEFKTLCDKAQQNNLIAFWVGGKRTADQQWTDVNWNDGTELSLKDYWRATEPSYTYDGKAETCLMVYRWTDGVWYLNDAPNDVSAYYAYNGKIGYFVECEK